jgi:hemerythrin-like domain-containing protein
MADHHEHTSMMLAIHDALRRDLDHLQRVADAESAGGPDKRAAVLAGWTFFSHQLHHHHQAEDDDLWPKARVALAGRAPELALLDAMEAEHAQIDPTIAEVDEALRVEPTNADRLVAAVDRFRATLVPHLRHEERDALPLLERTLDDRTWAQFSAQQAGKGGLRGLTDFMPWLLHEADPLRARQVKARLPPPLRIAVQRLALPRFAARERW